MLQSVQSSFTAQSVGAMLEKDLSDQVPPISEGATIHVCGDVDEQGKSFIHLAFDSPSLNKNSGYSSGLSPTEAQMIELITTFAGYIPQNESVARSMTGEQRSQRLDYAYTLLCRAAIELVRTGNELEGHRIIPYVTKDKWTAGRGSSMHITNSYGGSRSARIHLRPAVRVEMKKSLEDWEYTCDMFGSLPIAQSPAEQIELRSMLESQKLLKKPFPYAEGDSLEVQLRKLLLTKFSPSNWTHLEKNRLAFAAGTEDTVTRKAYQSMCQKITDSLSGGQLWPFRDIEFVIHDTHSSLNTYKKVREVLGGARSTKSWMDKTSWGKKVYM